jgi:hypothetical protein
MLYGGQGWNKCYVEKQQHLRAMLLSILLQCSACEVLVQQEHHALCEPQSPGLFVQWFDACMAKLSQSST